MNKLISMFGPKVLEEHNSKFSGQIRLMSGWGYKYIATGILTQSGGIVADVWKPVLKKLNYLDWQPKSCLILGLAAGTLAYQLAQKYKSIQITGVEIDPIMIDLGRRYFDLNKITSLEIIIQDADKYIQKTSAKYDLVFVDLYLGDQLPSFVYSHKFLTKLHKLGKLVVFNHLFYDDTKKAKAKELVESLKPLFPHIELVRSLTNLMIICS